MSPEERMHKIDALLSHVWMVRAFLKHCEEAEDDDELCQVHRTLYDYMLALGQHHDSGDAAAYLKQATKKWSKLRNAVELFEEIQEEVSSHTNFKMARNSLRTAFDEMDGLVHGA